MATVEYLEKRLESKQKEIAKLNKKLDRINKAKATNWEVNPYYYREYDLKHTIRDIERAEKALQDLQKKLEEANEKANSRNVKAIIEFLDRWQDRVRELYLKRFEKYPEALEQYKEDMKEFKLDYFDLRELKKKDPEQYREYKARKDAIESHFQSRFGFLDPYLTREFNPKTNRYDLWELDKEKLDKDLKAEADRKYDNIIERTNEITGKITDAAGLEVGDKGELDGFVIGERGTAKVHTIGAGGYNIQCFHFRVLVHEVK